MGFNQPFQAAQGSKTPSAEELHRKMLLLQHSNDPSLIKGLAAGLAAAVAGSLIWMAITYFTNFQIGWMAIGVGFLVGVAVRWAGHGSGVTFGILGATLSLFGCLLGNLLTACVSIAAQENIGIGQVLVSLNADIITQIFAVTFHPIDLLFYGLAVYWGYKYSCVEPVSPGTEAVGGETPPPSKI